MTREGYSQMFDSRESKPTTKTNNTAVDNLRIQDLDAYYYTIEKDPEGTSKRNMGQPVIECSVGKNQKI